ncbi:MAG: fatty acid--CoA ligase [Marmoricola sp.]
MRSTMQTPPLLISQLLRYGSTVHATSEVVTWTGDGTRRTTFAEIGKDAARLAHGLRALGVSGDDRVATFMWNNAEHLTVYLGVPSMGAVLHAWNIRLFPEQLVYVANHGGARVVVADNTLLPLLMPQLQHITGVEHVIVNGPVDDDTIETLRAIPHVQGVHRWDDLLLDQPETYDWPEDLDENDAAGLCYTSGTTGNPKGVAYSHRSNVLHSMSSAAIIGVNATDRVLLVVPLFHANAWGYPYTAFYSGLNLLMPDRFLQAEHLVPFAEQEKATYGAGVPTIWTDMLRKLDEGGHDFSSVKKFLIGGSAVPPSLLHGFWDRYGIDILQGWGMTETSPLASVAVEPAGLSRDDPDYYSYRLAQGRIVGGVEARLTDAAGDVVPWDGESVGEIELRGPWITGSYLAMGNESQAELDDMASKFHDGWLRTGDVGSITPNGYIRLTDRAKDVIKSGGEWISSVDLENALMGHPDVLEAAVIGVEDDKWGERPLANVVLKEGAGATPTSLRDFLSDSVAKWQLPERWAFIDEVPKTSVGKFDKKVLRQRYADGELKVEQL